MESEGLLGVISVAGTKDADNGEGTGDGDTPMCTVPSDTITKTEAGTHFLYDINWEPGKVQPGLIGAQHCFAFKTGDTWVPYSPPNLATWRYIMAAIIFDRLTRLNDGVALLDLIKSTHVLWEALAERGGLRLNDFFYDHEECSQQWVISDSNWVGEGVCKENDARRDAQWVWVPSSIPCEYGEIRMLVRDLMGNCWGTVYVNGDFLSRCLEYEMAESVDAATGRRLIPLENPVFSPIVEGKVFSGEDNICLRHIRGREVTYDGLFVSIWDPERTTTERLPDIDISATVFPQTELSTHSSAEMYGADLSMEFRDPLGVPFLVTYSDGLLRHIEYMAGEDMKGNNENAGIGELESEETRQPAGEVNGPPHDGPGGCDVDGPVADSGAGRVVVGMSVPVTGTVCTDGSRRTGQGTKQKATSPRNFAPAAKHASHDVIVYDDERWGEVTVHPFLLNYIQDYPERCAIATVRYSVCATCTVSKSHFDFIADFNNCRRSQSRERALLTEFHTTDNDDVRRLGKTQLSNLNMHTHVKENGLWGFYRGPEDDDPMFDYHLALQPDRMHTIEHGIFLHMLDAFKAAAFDKLSHVPQSHVLKELDARLQTLSERSSTTYPQLVLPVATGCYYFSREGRFEAKQNRSIMTVCVFIVSNIVPDSVGKRITSCFKKLMELYISMFRCTKHSSHSLDACDNLMTDFITTLKQVLGRYETSNRKVSKLHDLLHLRACIEHSGLPDSFAADVWEHHHQKFCKQPFLSPNKRKASFQMVNHVRRTVAFDDDIDRARKHRKRTTENWSSVMECSARGMNTLATRDTAKMQLRYFPRKNAGTNGNEGATGTVKAILDALPCKELFLEALHTYMSKNGCNPPPEDMLIRTRTHLAIAATGDGTTKGALVQTARASPNFHGKAVHSDVFVRAQTGSRREDIRLGEADVMCLAVGNWLNDNVMDMYLQSVYEEQCQGKDTAEVHVCTTFWNPQLLANQQGDTAKRGWELRVKSRTTKVHRQCKDLEVAPVVLIPINHKHHWMLLILLNVREFWTDGIIVDSCHGYASPDWKALRTLLWHEYLNDNRRGPDVTRQLVGKSWNTCRDVFGRGLIHARCSQQSNREDCGVYVCCMAEELITKLAHPPTRNGISNDDVLEIVAKMHIDERIVRDFPVRALDRIAECAAAAKGHKSVGAHRTLARAIRAKIKKDGGELP
ncbi:hypothetical protein CBR_g72644 [Chara braunii]|uniref:Ubiquitin-like protease family profile domain-containing protein n=1 Tax=Chara braunii TaxID=69332 RepID=A0A388KA41_CHABU|nr:hypothetical protein CBR_g72644 [Chara braunii]|eukprot:GBG66889.1 hypothetical protein CBR_g72644 [Chara braunii]